MGQPISGTFFGLRMSIQNQTATTNKQAAKKAAMTGMAYSSMSEDRQAHQRVFRLSEEQLRLTARLIQEEIAHLEGLTNRSGPSH